jgi:hypothetical protein
MNTFSGQIMLLLQVGVGIALLNNRANGMQLATLANRVLDGLLAG